jgi:C_GCAxxG_C_C family probable redox protein
MDGIEKEKAIQASNSGLNCAQSVLTAFSDWTGIDPMRSQAIAAAFGGGICRSGQTCGAVSGALMVIGIMRPDLSKSEIYELGNKFLAKFVAENGSTQCRALIGIDLQDPAALQKAHEDGIFQTRCHKYISDAVDILKAVLPLES